MSKNILVIGANRRLGFSLVQGLLPKVQKIFTVYSHQIKFGKNRRIRNPQNCRKLNVI